MKRRTGTLLANILICLRPWGAEVHLLTEFNVPQVRTMLTLHSTGPLRMSDLAARLHVGLPVATGLVNALEAKEMVCREHSHEDRRVVMCSCTETGCQEAERFWSGLHERVGELVAGLSEDQLEAVARGLELVASGGQLPTVALGKMSAQFQPLSVKGKRTEPPGERRLT